MTLDKVANNVTRPCGVKPLISHIHINHEYEHACMQLDMAPFQTNDSLIPLMKQSKNLIKLSYNY